MLKDDNSRTNLKIAHIHVADRNNKGDRAIVLAVQELLRQQFKHCWISNFSVALLKKGGAADLKKINSADLVVIGGGGIFYSYFLPYSLDFIKGIKKPIVILGAGYIREIGAPALSPASAQSVAQLVKAAALVGVRDNNTKKFLVAQGVLPATVEVIGDPAILLKEKKPRGFNSIEGNRKTSNQVPIRIGLNLNYSGWLGFGQWRADILGAYQEVTDYFQKKYGEPNGSGVEFYYFKHHPSEDNIYPALKIRDLKIVDLAPREQKYVYGKMDLVVGMMLHAGVLSVGAGTPAISVAYDLRNYSFAEFIGCPELVVDLDKLKKGELLQRAISIFTAREKYGLMFSRLLISINKKQRSFLNKINKYTENHLVN